MRDNRGRGGGRGYPPRGRGGRPGPRRGPAPGGKDRPGGGSRLRLVSLGDNAFELVHPRCIEERRDDYEEGLAIFQAGEPDEAREVLRFALEGCGDNLWIHVALGRIALETGADANLARGHYGYAVDLVLRALPGDFNGRLPRDRPANQPVYDALEGLATALDRLQRPADAASIRQLATHWGQGSAPPAAGRPPAAGSTHHAG